MQDKIKFMELLKEVAEIAKTQDNIITQEEIKKYFDEMELEEEQFEHIYNYLAANKIKVQGFLYHASTPVSVVEENQEEQQKTNEEDSAYLKMYLEDIESIIPLEQAEELELIRLVSQGDDTAKVRLMEGKLHIVVELAHKYKNKGILIEDLIQEGNLGLIQGLDNLSNLVKLEDGSEVIINCIKQAMEDVVDEQMNAKDWESTVIAKTALIHEASNYLAEDLGRVATAKELADFTKMSEEEVNDLIQLSLDAVKTSKQE